MMKNSKLSKLLVAGVSVAMLASAFAPMAFAEGSGVADIETPLNVLVYVSTDISTPAGINDTGKQAFSIDAEKNVLGLTYDSNNKRASSTIEVGPLTGNASTVDTTIDYEMFDIDGYEFTGKWSVYQIATTNGSWTNVATGDSGTVSLAALYNDSDFTPKADRLAIAFKVDEIDNAKVVSMPTKGGSVEEIVKPLKVIHGDDDPDEVTANTTEIYLDDTLILPNYTIADGYNYKALKLSVENSAGKTIYENTYAMAQQVAVSSLFADEDDIDGAEITLTVVAPQMKVVTANLPTAIADAKAEYTDKDGKKQYVALNTVAAGDTLEAASNDDLKLIADWDKTVYENETRKLPTYVVKKADTTIDTTWTFVRWAVETNDTVLANGKPANNYSLEGTTFDPTLFKADEDAAHSNLKLVPVFTKDAESADVITYSAAKTPNDKVIKYVNGKPENEKVVWGVANEFKGGLFYNEVDETFAYYLPLNTKGKWEIDTTVNGVADGVFFADGKQDTEAYGLKKVSGAAEDDKFFYLVSDGLYVDDYTDIWVDEDGSIYNLINGCTSDVPFTGIVEKDGWATSVKDSKVDDKANGFILYGETQYWFINGTCNLNETEAVREHTDGNFYYTVGAKIDFTFNGECNGHTFVNGVASK